MEVPSSLKVKLLLSVSMINLHCSTVALLNFVKVPASNGRLSPSKSEPIESVSKPDLCLIDS